MSKTVLTLLSVVGFFAFLIIFFPTLDKYIDTGADFINAGLIAAHAFFLFLVFVGISAHSSGIKKKRFFGNTASIFGFIFGICISWFGSTKANEFFVVIGVLLVFTLPPIIYLITGRTLVPLTKYPTNWITVDHRIIDKAEDKAFEDVEKEKVGISKKIIPYLLTIILYGFFLHQNFDARMQETNRRNHAQEILNHFDFFKKFYEEHNMYPTNAPITEKTTIEGGDKGATIEYELSVNFENNVIDITFGKGAFGEESYNITLIPKNEGSGINWDCKGGNLPAKYRPPACI